METQMPAGGRALTKRLHLIPLLAFIKFKDLILKPIKETFVLISRNLFGISGTVISLASNAAGFQQFEARVWGIGRFLGRKVFLL